MNNQNILYQVEALLFDYELGQMTYQPISQPVSSHRTARRMAFIDRTDHPSARVRPFIVNNH